MMFIVGFLWIFFVILRKFHSISTLPRVFITYCVKFYQIMFLHLLRILYEVLFYSVNVVNYIDRFLHFKSTLHSKKKKS